METFISKLDVTVCPSKVAGVLCLVREDPYEPHETEQWILTCSAHGKHHSEDFRFFLFNSYSFSLNQTGVHIYTEAAEKCFTVEHLGAQTMSDQYFHFIKLFFFLASFTTLFCPEAEICKWMFQTVPQTEHWDHLIFEYKQII